MFFFVLFLYEEFVVLVCKQCYAVKDKRKDGATTQRRRKEQGETKNPKYIFAHRSRRILRAETHTTIPVNTTYFDRHDPKAARK